MWTQSKTNAKNLGCMKWHSNFEWFITIPPCCCIHKKLTIFAWISLSLSSSSALFPWMDHICALFFSLSLWFAWMSFNNFCLIHAAVAVALSLGSSCCFDTHFMCCSMACASVSLLLLRISYRFFPLVHSVRSLYVIFILYESVWIFRFCCFFVGQEGEGNNLRVDMCLDRPIIWYVFYAHLIQSTACCGW